MNNLFNYFCENPNKFIDHLKDWKNFGTKTRVDKIDTVKRYTNEFWTSKQRASHSIHEISYRACFKAQLPNFFITRFTKESDLVYDPFMGRGTTLIEAAINNRNCIGNDINPLSKALVLPRLNPPSLLQIKKRLELIQFNYKLKIKNKDLLTFYHSKTLIEIEKLKNYFKSKIKNQKFDRVDNWIRMIVLNRLTGHSKGFFSVYTLPPNQAVSIESQKKINKKRKQKPEYRDTKFLILEKSKSLLRSGSIKKPKIIKIYNYNSWETKKIANNSISLTVTSPPFLDIVDYQKDNWLRCWFLDLNISKLMISQIKKIDQWENFVNKTIVELDRITKSKGYLAFEVGEIGKDKKELEQYVLNAAKNTSFKSVCVLINKQSFTKTSNAWGIKNNSKGTNTNRVVIFQKK